MAWTVNYYGMDLVAGPAGPGNHMCQVKQYEVSVTTAIKDERVWPSVAQWCRPVVRALALKSGDPGFKTRSDQLHL